MALTVAAFSIYPFPSLPFLSLTISLVGRETRLLPGTVTRTLRLHHNRTPRSLPLPQAQEMAAILGMVEVGAIIRRPLRTLETAIPMC